MKRILSIVITAILAGAFAVASLAPASASSEKWALHIEKNCTGFTGQVGGYCTITSSNLPDLIPIRSKVFYLEGGGSSGLDTDIVLYTGPGSSAIGHVVLNSTTQTVTFFGGTGQLRHFNAEADVSPRGTSGLNWGWDGTYHFNEVH